MWDVLLGSAGTLLAGVYREDNAKGLVICRWLFMATRYAPR